MNEKITNAPYRVLNMNNYIHDMLFSEISNFKKSGNIKTGFSNLDGITNLYPGLYVAGAISSLGKTTFCQQMADQIAEAGNHVLYFSLEQNTLELASKSLSRIMAKNDFSNAYTSLQIRNDENEQLIKDAISTYGEFAGKLTVLECSFAVTIDDIEKVVKERISEEKEKPIVFIDYLQAIQPSESSKSTKESVDEHVRRLKQLQSENELVVIVISSLNRQNYLNQIDYESFKESGGIEYTADVVWGLQLNVLHNADFEKKTINEKREMVLKAKSESPRKIELVCLKNRFGKSGYTCKFDYFPQFDWFRPDLSDSDLKKFY